MMTLEELYNRAVAGVDTGMPLFPVALIPKSRHAPLKTSVKHYAACFGRTPAQIGPEVYHLPDEEIRHLIDQKAPTHLRQTTLRNLKNDIVHLLAIAVAQGWLAPLAGPLRSWRARRPHPGSWVKRGEHGSCTPYRLEPEDCPPALLDEIKAYLAWCEGPVARYRDRRVVKRPVTSQKTWNTMLRLAGFAVRELGMAADTLTLRALCDPTPIEAFINWWLTTRRGKVTAGLEQYLLIPKTIAKHWLKDPELTSHIAQLMRGMPPSEPVRDKQKRWLSLKELDEVGLSLHPMNTRRLQDYPVLTKRWYTQKFHSKQLTALYVEFSLIIRLLIRLPMRQRQIRDMCLGSNLFQDHAGVWRLRFVGTQLKVAQVKGIVNEYAFPFPADLVPELEAWLRDWRPKLAHDGERHVFLSSRGKPFTRSKDICDFIARATYRFTGTGVTPHIIRDIWATEYLEANRGDVGGCARRLGNRPETVMAHYAHVLQQSADARADDFLRQTFTSA